MNHTHHVKNARPQRNTCKRQNKSFTSTNIDPFLIPSDNCLHDGISSQDDSLLLDIAAFEVVSSQLGKPFSHVQIDSVNSRSAIRLTIVAYEQFIQASQPIGVTVAIDFYS